MRFGLGVRWGQAMSVAKKHDPHPPPLARPPLTVLGKILCGACRRRRWGDAKGQKQHLCVAEQPSHSHAVKVVFPRPLGSPTSCPPLAVF